MIASRTWAGSRRSLLPIPYVLGSLTLLSAQEIPPVVGLNTETWKDLSSTWLLYDLRDRDSNDVVLHARELETGATSALGTWSFVLLDGDRVVLSAIEAWKGNDLNGDEDRDDKILRVLDLRSGARTDLPLAGVRGIQGNWIVLDISEDEEDLDEDGNTRDRVVWAENLIDRRRSFLPDGVQFESMTRTHILGFYYERSKGDANGDGDSDDYIPVLLDLEAGSTKYLGVVARSTEVLQYSDSVYLIAAREDEQTPWDLNGDGDSDDIIIHVHDVLDGSTKVLPYSMPRGSSPAGIAAGGDRFAFPVSEEGQGRQDLDADGRIAGNVIHVHDLGSGMTRNLNVKGNPVAFLGGSILFDRYEDVPDPMHGSRPITLSHVYELDTKTIFSIGRVNRHIAHDKDHVVFYNEESEEDLNGDGDSSDIILSVHDMATHRTTHLPYDALDGPSWPPPLPAVTGPWLVFEVSESGQGGQDLNFDGDATDSVLHVHDLERGMTRNLGLDFRVPQTRDNPWYLPIVSGRWIVFEAAEANQGNRNLNGDGDTEDNVLFVHDAETGMTTSLGVATLNRAVVRDPWLAFQSSEYLQLADMRRFQDQRFLRGDCDGDGVTGGTVTDAVFLLRYNFLGAEAPSCMAACDANGDGEVDGRVSDAIYLLQFSFFGKGQPVWPFPFCGGGGSKHDFTLGCERPLETCSP